MSALVGGAVVDVIPGWEPRTCYLKAEGVTRGQAKSAVAWDMGEAFTDMRCRKVWMQEREIPEDEACDYWLDDWYPGYVAWIECAKDASNAIAYWKVEWPRINW